jgi:uncharacterized protein YqhQ
MMRSPRYFAIACRRRSTGEVVVKLEPVSSVLPPWLKWLNKPFLRGTAALIDAMAMGIRSLTYSANLQLEDEQMAGDAEGVEEAKAAGALNLAMGEGVTTGSATQTAVIEPAPSRNGSKPEAPPSVVSQSINGIAIGLTTIIALMFGFILFWTIPGLITDTVVGGHAHAASLFGHHTIQTTEAHSASRQIGLSLVEGVIRLVIFFLYLGMVARMKHVQRVFEYHGAEHKAINTLEAELPLTVENARGITRIHPRCGTNFIFIVLITAMLIFTVIPRYTIHDGIGLMLSTHLLRLALMPIVAGVAFEILKFAGTHRDKKWAMALIAPGLWTQYITTREPDDSQIEVAIKSLQAVWDKEHQTTGGEEDVAAAVA